MDFLLTLATVIFVVMLLSVALTFGFFLLLWFIGTAIAVSIFMMIGQWYRRWRFLRSGKSFPPSGKTQSHVIEVDYEDISDKRD